MVIAAASVRYELGGADLLQPRPRLGHVLGPVSIGLHIDLRMKMHQNGVNRAKWAVGEW